jgi:hypothetical protein
MVKLTGVLRLGNERTVSPERSQPSSDVNHPRRPVSPGKSKVCQLTTLRCSGLLLFALAPLTALGTPPEPEANYELVRVIAVAGRQGIATDGDRYYVSGSKALFVYSKSGELLRSNEAPFDRLQNEANHIGDISVHDGKLYAGIEWFEDGRGRDIQIAIYDAKTLRYLRSIPWESESGQVEVSAVTVDEDNGQIWMTDWVNGSYVYRYDLTTGNYNGKLHLRPVPQWQQGIAASNGALYITADDGDAEDGEVDNLWKVTPDLTSTAAYVRHEFAFDSFRDVGEIEGIAFDPTTGEMLVLSNRGKRIVLGMPKGLYPGYERELHEVYIYRVR